MKVYLVVDDWQYDGGLYILAAYTDPTEALVRQQKERREAEPWRHFAKNTAALEAIRIEEIEVIA